MVSVMKKISFFIFLVFIHAVSAEDISQNIDIKKLHVDAEEDAYVVSFKGTPRSFAFKDIKIQKPKGRLLKKLRFINDDDEYAIKVIDKNGIELIAIGIGNPFYATYEHIGYEDREFMGGPVSSANIEIAIPLEFKPGLFIISKRDNLGKFKDFQEIVLP
jgi:hypothetical protein